MTIAETKPRCVVPEMCLVADEVVWLPTGMEPLGAGPAETLAGAESERPSRREFWVGD